MHLDQILYFSTASIVILWLARAFHDLKKVRSFIQGNLSFLGLGILGALAISATVFVSIRPDYRVLSDEATLTSISQMMHRDKTASTLFMTKWKDGQVVPLAQGIDKRPTLYPFTVHLVHGLLGYSLSNPFIVNFFVLTALLTLIYLPIGILWGRTTGHICQLLVAAQAPIMVAASSAGFDLFSSLLLVSSFLLTAFTVQKKSTPTLPLTLITLVLFAYTRYESILFSSLMFLFVIAALRPSAKFFFSQLKWLIWFPILLVPLFLLLLESRDSRFYEVKVGEAVFSWTNWVAHLGDLVKGLYFPPSYLPNQTLFHGMVVLSAFGLLLNVLRTKVRRSTLWILSLAGLIVCFQIILILSHFFGSYLKADALRLFTSVVIPWSILPGILIGVLAQRKTHWARTGQGIGFLLAIFLFTHSVIQCSRPELFADVGGMHAYKTARKFLENIPKEGTLAVSSYPTHFAILDLASINFDTFQRNWEKISKELSSGQLKHVYVFQSIPLATGNPTPEEDIRKLPLDRTIHQEISISSRNRIRISEITIPANSGLLSRQN